MPTPSTTPITANPVTAVPLVSSVTVKHPEFDAIPSATDYTVSSGPSASRIIAPSTAMNPAAVPSVNLNNPVAEKKDDDHTKDKAESKNSLKALAIVLVLGLTSALSIFAFDRYRKSIDPSQNAILMQTSYTDTNWQTYGMVFEPLVTVPVYFPNEGYRDQEFLLDSGAIVSSLPRELATELGLSLSQLPRILFSGFGGSTSFGYQADLKILLGDEEITIPVVFTEAAGTQPILGRSGFFEEYSIYFNARSKKIEIIK